MEFFRFEILKLEIAITLKKWIDIYENYFICVNLKVSSLLAEV